MIRILTATMAAMLTFVVTTAAQETIPTPQEQLNALNKSLDLSADQQVKVKTILDQLHDATVKIVEEKSLTHDQKVAKVRPWRYDTDKKIRAILTDDQKKRLDQFEHEPHPEMHGSLH